MEQNHLPPVIVVNLVDNDEDDNEPNENNCEEEAPEENDSDAEDLLAEQERQRAVLVSEEMRVALVSNYVAPILQINCVVKEGKTIEEALTTGGDHYTPCKWRQLGDPDGCFWSWNSIQLVLLGCRVRERNSTM